MCNAPISWGHHCLLDVARVEPEAKAEQGATEGGETSLVLFWPKNAIEFFFDNFSLVVHPT